MKDNNRLTILCIVITTLLIILFLGFMNIIGLPEQSDSQYVIYSSIAMALYIMIDISTMITIITIIMLPSNKKRKKTRKKEK